MWISGYLNNYYHQIKNLYGNLSWLRLSKNQYFLKLDGYYYCNWRKSTIVVITVRNKRISQTINILDIVKNKEYLKEIHPFHAFILGILANNERNGIVNKENVGLKNIRLIKNCPCNTKFSPLIDVFGTYIDENNNKITILKSRLLNKKIKILSSELYKNQHLLNSMDSLQAVSIGYEASESFIKNY